MCVVHGVCYSVALTYLVLFLKDNGKESCEQKIRTCDGGQTVGKSDVSSGCTLGCLWANSLKKSCECSHLSSTGGVGCSAGASCCGWQVRWWQDEKLEGKTEMWSRSCFINSFSWSPCLLSVTGYIAYVIISASACEAFWAAGPELIELKAI